MTLEADAILANLHALADPENAAGMARFGINPSHTLGISIYDLRKIANQIGVNQQMAMVLWRSEVHEARILASYVADPALMDEALIEAWVADFNSWDVCDQVCDLFAKTPFAYAKAIEWAARPEEFVKRSGFVIMAHLAVYDKSAPDEKLAQFFPVICQQANDERNFVKKAVNWALRNLGKRNRAFNRQAIDCAQEIRLLNTTTARWIAADAIRELSSQRVQDRLKS